MMICCRVGAVASQPAAAKGRAWHGASTPQAEPRPVLKGSPPGAHRADVVLLRSVLVLLGLEAGQVGAHLVAFGQRVVEVEPLRSRPGTPRVGNTYLHPVLCTQCCAPSAVHPVLCTQACTQPASCPAKRAAATTRAACRQWQTVRACRVREPTTSLKMRFVTTSATGVPATSAWSAVEAEVSLSVYLPMVGAAGESKRGQQASQGHWPDMVARPWATTGLPQAGDLAAPLTPDLADRGEDLVAACVSPASSSLVGLREVAHAAVLWRGRGVGLVPAAGRPWAGARHKWPTTGRRRVPRRRAGWASRCVLHSAEQPIEWARGTYTFCGISRPQCL